jgi:hypothetical protein
MVHAKLPVVRDDRPHDVPELFPGFVVQPYAPPNFIPVAWTCGQNWVKVLRVPVPAE